jgi:beta-glucosidase
MVEEGDMEEIATRIDFLGLNYYTTVTVSTENEESNEPEAPVGPGAPEGFTEMGWRNNPRGLTDFLERVADSYSPDSILVTENGASYTDGPDVSGRVADSRRIEYLDSHIAATLTAREAGVPVDGYFVWSLLDNVEWTQGFSQRFGLVWVDMDTGERTPKDSYYWYRDRIKTSDV